MVEMIEPRKGYLQVRKAFDEVFGKQVNLIIVGDEGWIGLPGFMRRTVPSLVATLKAHPESGQKLVWLEGASDEYLQMSPVG